MEEEEGEEEVRKIMEVEEEQGGIRGLILSTKRERERPRMCVRDDCPVRVPAQGRRRADHHEQANSSGDENF